MIVFNKKYYSVKDPSGIDFFQQNGPFWFYEKFNGKLLRNTTGFHSKAYGESLVCMNFRTVTYVAIFCTMVPFNKRNASRDFLTRLQRRKIMWDVETTWRAVLKYVQATKASTTAFWQHLRCYYCIQIHVIEHRDYLDSLNIRCKQSFTDNV